MLKNFFSPKVQNIWPVMFILIGLSWLWAPQLNHVISAKTSLISQYEVSSQPYSWLFRLCDFSAGALLAWLFFYGRGPERPKIGNFLFLTAAIGTMLDPIFSTSCRMVGNSCVEYVSTTYVFHATETVITSFAIFGLSLFDYIRNKGLVSLSFSIFQIGYGILFLTQFVSANNFNTVSQFAYQIIIIFWLAWYARKTYLNEAEHIRPNLFKKIRKFFAIWALINGVMAILVSLAIIKVFGRLDGIYFANDSAWLSQHSVLVGVVMIYLSRHLARGEQRARQIFMAISAVEIIKYSAIAPNGWLLATYLITFCGLFLSQSAFARGNIVLSFRLRLKDALYSLIILTVSGAIIAWILELKEDRSKIASSAYNHFLDFTVRSNFVEHHEIRSVLLAHTSTAFLTGGVFIILWALFRPNPKRIFSFDQMSWMAGVLKQNSSSSEDFFKLWPQDKKYFVDDFQRGFIAFKQVGSTVFALADPIASSNEVRKNLLGKFINQCQAARLRVCFLPVTTQSLDLYKSVGLQKIQIGSNALINIANFNDNTALDKWWRWQKNRAIKAGFEYGYSDPPHSPELINRLKNISDMWLQKEGHEERGFALGYFDQNYLDKSRLHYLTGDNGHIVAFANQIPVYGLKIASIDLMRHLPEVDNAMPYLLSKTIENIGASENVEYFDLGFVPFANTKGAVTSIAKLVGSGKFSYEGLKQFKNKFDPDWQPVFMVYDGDLADLSLIALNLEKAMSL